MVKLSSKLVVASILIGASVPADAMWRSFVSRMKSLNFKQAAVIAGGSALLGKGAVDVYATTPMHDRWTRLDGACHRGNLWLVKALHYLGGDIHIHSPSDNYWGATPLHIAASSGRKNVVDYLLRENAAVDGLTVDNRTALHEACRKGHTEVAIALLDKGSEINSVDCDGKTPLHDACKSGNVDLVEELLMRGADLSIRDHKGKSVLDIPYSNPRICTVLCYYVELRKENPEALS